MRLQLAASSKTQLILWIKGSKEKFKLVTTDFNKSKNEIMAEGKFSFLPGAELLASFEARGMSFFSKVKVSGVAPDEIKILFYNDLFKSERRNSYRLLTYPNYNVNAHFGLGEQYKGGSVFPINKKPSQTEIFKNFLKIVEDSSDAERTVGKFRVQDLSVTGMSINIGDLETDFFIKDQLFHNVKLTFPDEQIILPEVKVVYIINAISAQKSGQKFRVGLHFSNLPSLVDDQLGRKINKLLRHKDTDQDFENFIK